MDGRKDDGGEVLSLYVEREHVHAHCCSGDCDTEHIRLCVTFFKTSGELIKSFQQYKNTGETDLLSNINLAWRTRQSET